jgi:cytochrome c553
MRTGVVVLVLVAMLAAAAIVVSGQSVSPPPWAYGYLEPGPEPPAPPCPADAKPLDCARPQTRRPDDVTHTLPGSDGRYTEFQIHDDFGPADWYPGDHPAMPDIVARGRERDRLRACALCHYPNGIGKPENGPAGGLPAAYILQQLEAFKNGTRRSADPRKANTNEMIQIARHLSPEEMNTVAEYFSAIKWRPWVRVVETDSVPKARPGVNGLFIPLPGNETEPLGNRILEVPENPEFTERMRSPRSGFVAYAPKGSVARGELLVTKGDGKTTQCGICHGADLQGRANVPGIADRPVSYLVRQMFDYHQGTRVSPLMQPVVAKLTTDDMLAIGAYLGSR